MIKMKDLVRGAIGMTIVYLVTSNIPPLQPTFFNFSEAVIMIIAFMFGPRVGVMAAMGAALADYTLGYSTYIIFTMFTKGITAYLIGANKDRIRNSWTSRIVLPVIAAICMIATYGLHDQFIYGQFWIPNNIFWNIVQGSVAVVLFNAFLLKGKNLNID